MNTVWGALADALGLEPDRRRIGSPRLGLSLVGRHAGARITLSFRPDALRAVVAARADTVLGGEDDLRIVPRALVGGWSGGAETGDPDFDAAVAVVAADPEGVRLRLDRPTRALLAEMIELGAWVTDEQILIEPRATASARTTDEARALIETAADLLRALRRPSPRQVVEMAFGDPAEPQRRLARARMRAMAGDARWAGPILDGLSRHHPGDGPELLTRLAPHCAADFEHFIAACDRYAAESTPALLAARDIARDLGDADRTAWVERIAAAMTDPRRADPEPDILAREPALVRALLPRLADHPAALDALAALPVGDEGVRVQLAAAGGARDPEGAARRLVGLRPRTADGEAGVVRALAALPPAAGHPALAELRPTSGAGRRALFEVLCAGEGPAIDAALVDWAVRAPSVVQSAQPRVFAEAARRICVALDAAPDPPLIARCPTELPPALARTLTAALSERRPRHGAAWLARHAPDHRSTDPEREARLLDALAGLGDPAGEARCIAALEGSDFLRITAARALARLGTARALGPLDGLTGFFAPGDVKAAAQAAIAAIRDRETRGPRGGLSVGEAGGELSLEE